MTPEEERYTLDGGRWLNGNVDDGQGGLRRSRLDLSDCFRIFTPQGGGIFSGHPDGYGHLKMMTDGTHSNLDDLLAEGPDKLWTFVNQEHEPNVLWARFENEHWSSWHLDDCVRRRAGRIEFVYPNEPPHWISDLIDDLAKAADIISSENPTEAAYEQSEEETMKALVDHEIGNEDDIEWYRGCYFESNHWVRRGD